MARVNQSTHKHIPSMSKTSSYPASYVAYRWEETNGPLVKVDVPWKEPKEGEVVVKVLACGVCGS